MPSVVLNKAQHAIVNLGTLIVHNRHMPVRVPTSVQEILQDGVINLKLHKSILMGSGIGCMVDLGNT